MSIESIDVKNSIEVISIFLKLGNFRILDFSTNLIVFLDFKIKVFVFSISKFIPLSISKNLFFLFRKIYSFFDFIFSKFTFSGFQNDYNLLIQNLIYLKILLKFLAFPKFIKIFSFFCSFKIYLVSKILFFFFFFLINSYLFSKYIPFFVSQPFFKISTIISQNSLIWKFWEKNRIFWKKERILKRNSYFEETIINFHRIFKIIKFWKNKLKFWKPE